MKVVSSLLLCVLLAASVPLSAQDSTNCPAGDLQLAASGGGAAPSATPADSAAAWAKRSTVNDATPVASVTPSTEAEAFVQNRVSQDGLHVVHFWAPWCSNSKSELANGWSDLVEDNPDVTFTFVTVWNDNQDGASTLDTYDLPSRVAEVTQPDLGPSDIESNRRHSFLSLPITWIPSTWIFHNNGELAFAMNYGEMEMQTIQSLLDVTARDW